MSHVFETLTLFVLLCNMLSDYKILHVDCTKIECNPKHVSCDNLKSERFTVSGACAGRIASNLTMPNSSRQKIRCRVQNLSSKTNTDEEKDFGLLLMNQRTILESNSSQYDKQTERSVSTRISRFRNESTLLHNLVNDSDILNYHKYDFSKTTSYYFNGSVIEIDYLSQRTFQNGDSKTLMWNRDFTNITDNESATSDIYSNHTDSQSRDVIGNVPYENGTENDSLISQFESRYPVESWYQFGYFTEDYLRSINRHWLQFEPPYRSSHYILGALYVVVMVVGTCGNCLVVFMYARCRSLRVPANTLVINLAISDFIMLVKMPIFIFNSVYFGPVLGEPGCKLYGFLGGLAGTVSITTLAAIALDRYYAIVHPLDPLRNTTHLRARLSVLFVWSYGCLFAALPLTKLGLNRYVPEGYLTSCSFDYLTSDMNSRIFIFVFFVAAWLLPFTVITACYFGIFLEVIKTGSAAACRRGQEVEKRRTEIRLASMVIGVIGLWFLAWTPYAIVALFGIFGFHNLISPLGSMIPALFCKFASCIDPYVYAFTHPKFRREITRLFLPRRSRVLQRNETRLKSHTYASRVSSIQIKQPEDNCTALELDEIKINVHRNNPWKKTFLFGNAPLPKFCDTTIKTCQSLQDSKKGSSDDYSITNSSPF